MRLAKNLKADTETERTTFATHQIIDVPAMTQNKGGGKVKMVVRALMKILQNIITHRHPLLQINQSTQPRFDTTTSHRENMLEQVLHQRQDADRQNQPGPRVDDSTHQQSRRDNNQTLVLRGGYTQIMVNPVQLTDAEFTNWMEKLVEARKNRQERKPRSYRNFRKPYNRDQSEYKKPQLKNKLHPAQELDVQSIMTTFNCEYDDVVEAVDLYNMDVEESQSA